MTDPESPTQSVAEVDSPATQSDSSATEGVGEATQQAETSGQVEGQTAEVTQTAEGAQADAAQPEEEFEDGPPPENAAPKHLRDFAERQQRKAQAHETALQPFGGLEGFQEFAQPLTKLASPTSNGVDALEAVFQIAPHLDREDFITAGLDALPDETAKAYLEQRGDDVAKMLFGDILGPDVTMREVLDTLSLYKPDEEQIPEHFRRELEESRREREEGKREREAAQADKQRQEEAESARRLQAIHLDLSKEAWVTPIEHVIGKIFGEMPKDAPAEVSEEWKSLQDDARILAQLEASKLPYVQQALDNAGKYAEMATQAKTPEQRAQFEKLATRQARSAAEEFKKVAARRVTAAKRRFDAQMSLRSSEASRATDQRAEVAGGAGSAGVSSGNRGPMPPYGTPEWEKWATAGFSSQPQAY
jgi:hypothetical protein